MCGRFAQPRSPDELARIFRARRVTELEGDRFNVAPTDEVAAVVERHADGRRGGVVGVAGSFDGRPTLLLHDRHHYRERAPRAVALADAGHPRRGGLGRLARRRSRAARPPRAASTRPGRCARGVPGRDGGQQRPQQRPDPARSAPRAGQRVPLLKIALPPDAMVVIVGIAGSGKSTFAGARFALTEILSSDAFRAMVADDEADQSASVDAFAMLHAALRFRLRRGRLSVVDATNVEEWSRRELLDIAARERRPAVAIVLDLSMEVCLERLS